MIQSHQPITLPSALIAELVAAEEVVVARAVRPADVVGPPMLFAFIYVSLEAYACCVYIRWKLPSTHPFYFTCLLAAKAQVTSIWGSTAPRSELSALL